MTCSLCDKPVFSRGWCQAHYNRWWRRGTTDLKTSGQGCHTELLNAVTPSDDDGFWDQVDRHMKERFS